MQVIKMADPYHYAYVFSPYLKPIARVKPGETVFVETQDAYGGAITSPNDIPSQLVRLPYVNPQTGPIYIILKAPKREMRWPWRYWTFSH